MKIYIKLNCDSLGYMYLKIETYDSHMGKGKLTSSFTPEPKWDYFASGSPGDIIASKYFDSIVSTISSKSSRCILYFSINILGDK